MVRWACLLELCKVSALAGLWLIVCVTVLGAQPTPFLFGICFLVGFFLRGESLIQLMQGLRPRIRFDNDVFYSNSFRLYGQVVKGSIDCAQDYQAINALVLAAPVSLALDDVNNAMYMVLYSKTKEDLRERKETAFLQFSQIFPDSKVLARQELKEFYQQFISETSAGGTELARTLTPVTSTSLHHLLTNDSEFSNSFFGGMMVVPYIQALPRDNESSVHAEQDHDYSASPEGWLARQPYLFIDRESSYRLEEHQNGQSVSAIPITPDLIGRISLLLPLKGSATEEATVCTTVLAQLLERRRQSSALTPILFQDYQASSDLQEAAAMPTQATAAMPTQATAAGNLQNKPEEITIEEASHLLNLLDAEQSDSGVSSTKPETPEKCTQETVFCSELCRLRELSLPKDILLDLCQGFQQQSLQMLKDPNIRSQLERAKLAGIDELVAKARELGRDLPAKQVLCLLSIFATSKESAFDLRELNNLITVLRLTLPLWKDDNAEIGAVFPEKAPSCSYCHLKGFSSESCAKISTHLDHLVSALVYRLAENPHALSRAERVDLGRRIIEELRSQDIKIIVPCVVRAVVSQLNLPPSEENLWFLASSNTSAVQNFPLSISGRN